ncbi:hypothetical protein R4Y45_04190 [Holzapfeliella sp. He02]|uniref:Lipoprotein n=1 Tax=Holzapfeliella saturejae TaxID=3082953 RepID=A0ABU8SGB4_9LACO
MKRLATVGLLIVMACLLVACSSNEQNYFEKETIEVPGKGKGTIINKGKMLNQNNKLVMRFKVDLRDFYSESKKEASYFTQKGKTVPASVTYVRGDTFELYEVPVGDENVPITYTIEADDKIVFQKNYYPHLYTGAFE